MRHSIRRSPATPRYTPPPAFGSPTAHGRRDYRAELDQHPVPCLDVSAASGGRRLDRQRAMIAQCTRRPSSSTPSAASSRPHRRRSWRAFRSRGCFMASLREPIIAELNPQCRRKEPGAAAPHGRGPTAVINPSRSNAPNSQKTSGKFPNRRMDIYGGSNPSRRDWRERVR